MVTIKPTSLSLRLSRVRLLTNFNRQARNKLSAGEKQSKQQNTQHPQVCRMVVHSFKNGRMNIDQESNYISADQQGMKQDGKKMGESPDQTGRMWGYGRIGGSVIVCRGVHICWQLTVGG